MAKAQYHKNQRVFVRPVGTWAQIERVLPQWTKGLDEPIRVFYDVGLGRDFTAEELQSESALAPSLDTEGENWRIIRGRNKWQTAEDCSHHPHPGTYPIVVTTDTDWGGWRVPGAEYDLNPRKIEAQARLISAGPKFYALARAIVDYAGREAGGLSDDLVALVRDAKSLIKAVDSSD